jgi:hypothetical protein
MSAAAGPPAHDLPIAEAAYKKVLDVVADEIYEAIYIHHVMEEINRLSIEDPNILLAMNEEPMFWLAHRCREPSGAIHVLGAYFRHGRHGNLNPSVGSHHGDKPTALLKSFVARTQDRKRTRTSMAERFLARDLGTTDCRRPQVSKGRLETSRPAVRVRLQAH